MTREEAAILLKAELATMTFTEETKDRIQALYIAIIALEELPKRKERSKKMERRKMKNREWLENLSNIDFATVITDEDCEKICEYGKLWCNGDCVTGIALWLEQEYKGEGVTK